MRKFLSLGLILCMLLPLLPIFSLPSFASDVVKSDAGLTIGRYNETVTSAKYADAAYEASKKLTSFPQTVEAWVYVPQSMARERVGVIIGNYSNFSDYEAHLNFEIHSNRIPRIQWYDEVNKGKYDIKFTDAAVPVEEWTHLTFVYDCETGIASCYLNGELAEEQYFYPEYDTGVLDFPMVLGGDHRNLNTQYFKGALQDVAVYSDVRTAEEINSDFKNGMSRSDEALLCYYDIDASDIGKDIRDESGNGYDLEYSKTWLTEEEMKEVRADYGFESAYSFAVIGDTQYTTEKYPDNLPKLYQWIVDEVENGNEKNIQYVMGLGDITNDDGKAKYTDENGNTYTQWDTAADAIKLLDGVIDYSLVRGNHDMYQGGTKFDELFASDPDYAGQFERYGGTYEKNSVKSTWRTFTVGKVNYLFLNLDFGADDGVLAWASELLDRPEYKDHKVIVTTHAYLYADGSVMDDTDCSPAVNRGAQLNNGDDMWNEFVKKHANIEMVLCGHIYYNDIVVSRVKGDNGNTVTQMLIDPQSVDSSLGGLGIVAMFYFSEDGQQVAVEYYSTVRGLYFKNCNQITIDLSEEGEAAEDELWDGTAVKPGGKGTESDPYRVESAGNLLWMAKNVTAGDTLDICSASFDGAYFEQTQDIDLDGKTIYSIGYYFADESQMAAFGGHYDGNGYSIKNGTVTVASQSHAFNWNWGHGLFGVIYGATVENVVLEDLQIIGRGVTGAVVGRAAAPTVAGATAEFNVISGCEVKDSVEIVTMRSTGTYKAPNGYDDALRAGRVGSVCGMAHGTLIKACTSDAEFVLSGDFGFAGGIVGTAGCNTVVDHCAFTGGFTLVDNSSTQTSSFGGIVGAVSANTQTKDSSGSAVSAKGYLQITNSYNSGYFRYTGADAKKNVHWGGIIGFFGWLKGIQPTDDEPYPYLIENCYNLYAREREDSSDAQQFVAGIVAKTIASGSTLWVKDCMSVEVDAAGDMGDNELRRNNENQTSVDRELSVVALTDSAGKSTVKTADAEDMADEIVAIGAKITEMRKSGAMQESKWITGKGVPTDRANAGDMYLDTETNDLYRYDDGWVFVSNIGAESGAGTGGSESTGDPEPTPGTDAVGDAGRGDGNLALTVMIVVSAVLLVTNVGTVVFFLIRKKKN